jgi:hypothetical protein
MASTRGRLLVLGGNPLHGSDVLGSRMGACLWDLSLGQHTGDGKLDGETFLGRTWMFFLGGAGEGKRNSRARLTRRLGGSRSSIALGRHVCCSTSTARRPSPHIEDGEGVVAPRSVTDSTEQWV